MARTAPTGPTTPGPARPPGRGLAGVVLLVEDDDAVRTVARRMLELRGMTVLPADGPAEALRVAAAYPDGLDVLVTDVHMPGMDGPELVAQLRAARPGLRVVYMSGYLADELPVPVWTDSRAVFLQKPFTPAQLADALIQVLSAENSPNPDPPAGGSIGPPGVDDTAF